jgi:hypothetical protein
MAASFTDAETGDESTSLTPSHLRDLNQAPVTITQTTQFVDFLAAEYSNVQFWALDPTNAQAFLNGATSWRGYQLNGANGTYGLQIVTLPPGTYYIGAIYQGSLGSGQSVPIFDELSAVSAAGENFIGNVPMAVGGQAGAWSAQGFQISGSPDVYIETEASAGKFMLMSTAQFQSFEAAYPNGFTGGSYSYLTSAAYGGAAGTPAAELEGDLKFPAGTYYLVWINDSGGWAGGAANLSGFASSTGNSLSSSAAAPPSNTGNNNGAGAPAGGGAAGTLLVGGPGNDQLVGGPGNDTLQGGGGNNSLDGGGGLNTALFTGLFRGYSVSTPASGVDTVSGGLDGGTNTLVNIQRLQFADGYLATSVSDTAGQVYRIYETTLRRAPDPVGLASWVHLLNSGTETLQQVVDGFVGSQEFQTVYGALTNTQFVTLLYNNALHRAPDPTGLGYWVGLLNTGADTRSQVVLGFSESQEEITSLTAPVQSGLWIGDPNAAVVARLYDAVLGRLPDQAGEISWTKTLDGGVETLQQVVDGFVGSPEFQTRYGNLNNTQFVTLLYNNVLHRAPDTAGLNSWVGLLNNGSDSRSQVVLGFSESPEHTANMAPYTDHGIWFT